MISQLQLKALEDAVQIAYEQPLDLQLIAQGKLADEALKEIREIFGVPPVLFILVRVQECTDGPADYKNVVGVFSKFDRAVLAAKSYLRRHTSHEPTLEIQADPTEHGTAILVNADELSQPVEFFIQVTLLQ